MRAGCVRTLHTNRVIRRGFFAKRNSDFVGFSSAVVSVVDLIQRLKFNQLMSHCILKFGGFFGF